MIRKEIKKYYFNVEGETEKWYLEWLQNRINEVDETNYNVKFDIKVEKNPKKRVKQLNILKQIEIVQMFDFEEENNEKNFQNILSNMREAEKMRSIKYILGYSNYTFDLWIILHKKILNASQGHRNHYLQYINKYYNENFESMSDYKKEDNFEKILSKIDINDVKKAILNSEKIIQNKYNQGYTEMNYRKYKYFRENPSLNIHIIIKKIFKEVGIL